MMILCLGCYSTIRKTPFCPHCGRTIGAKPERVRAPKVGKDVQRLYIAALAEVLIGVGLYMWGSRGRTLMVGDLLIIAGSTTFVVAKIMRWWKYA